jgi:hypothetical protein
LPVHAHRALLYVQKLNSVGLSPSARDVDVFAVSDGPRAAQYESAFTAGISSALLTLTRGTKVADGEAVTGWLLRMGWLDVTDDSRLNVSDLGAALLEALRRSPVEWSLEREGAAAVVLEPDDPFVYAEVTRLISEAGAALLVDPYFKADMLEWLLNATQVSRLLLSRVGGQSIEVEQVSLALHGLRKSPITGRVEIRSTDSGKLHDRCIVKPDGGVILLGTSLTGVGRHLSTFVPMPAPAASAMRREIGKIWTNSDPVTAKPIRRAEGAL